MSEALSVFYDQYMRSRGSRGAEGALSEEISSLSCAEGALSGAISSLDCGAEVQRVHSQKK